MTISFFEQGDIPQPSDKVRIEHLAAHPYEDGWRVGLEVHVTPFQQRPSLEIGLFKKRDEDAQIVAHLSIIETMHPKMEFTMHIRGVDQPYGDYEVRAVLFFREAPPEGEESVAPIEPTDTRIFELTIPQPGNG